MARKSMWETLYDQERARRWQLEEELNKLAGLIDGLLERSPAFKRLEERVQELERQCPS